MYYDYARRKYNWNEAYCIRKFNLRTSFPVIYSFLLKFNLPRDTQSEICKISQK